MLRMSSDAHDARMLRASCASLLMRIMCRSSATTVVGHVSPCARTVVLHYTVQAQELVFPSTASTVLGLLPQPLSLESKYTVSGLGHPTQRARA